MNKVRTQIREKRIRTECKKSTQSNQKSDENALDLVEKLREVSLNSNHLAISSNDLNFESIKYVYCFCEYMYLFLIMWFSFNYNSLFLGKLYLRLTFMPNRHRKVSASQLY